MGRSIEDGRRMARRLIGAGAKVAEIEAALVNEGVEPAVAAGVVEEVLEEKLAGEANASAGRPFGWVRVVLGLGLAAGAMVGIWVCLTGDPEGPLHAWYGERRIVVAGLGGLAVAGLGLAWTEFLRFVRGEV